MNNKWAIFAPCINEAQLIEAKIQWGLRHDFEVVIVEGHHPAYQNHDPNGLSNDGTTEILLSYEDRIKYVPVGPVEHEMVLRDIGYKKISKDTDAVIMCDIDEFYLDKDLEYIDDLFRGDKIKHILTNSYIFLDNEYCAPHIQRKQSPPFFYADGINIHFGQWHERIFRYNKFYSYKRSPFLVNDIYGRFVFNDLAYFGERMLLPDVYMLHYKNFKRAEAEKRTEMYDTYGDGVKHDTEWEELEKNKIKYEGEHPKEILNLL